MDQHHAVFQLADLMLFVGHKMGREESAVELHAFDHVDVGFGLAAFLDGDDAVACRP